MADQRIIEAVVVQRTERVAGELLHVDELHTVYVEPSFRSRFDDVMARGIAFPRGSDAEKYNVGEHAPHSEKLQNLARLLQMMYGFAIQWHQERDAARIVILEAHQTPTSDESPPRVCNLCGVAGDSSHECSKED